MNTKLLGERIKEARTNRNISLDALASQIGVNKSTVSRYERGEIDNPKLPVIHSIANELRVNPAWLCGKDEDRTYTPPNSNFELYSPNNLFAPLKTLRKSRELSMEDVAYGIGISKKDYACIEQGGNIDCITLARLADYFCCSIDFILAFDGVVDEEYHVEFGRDTLLRLHHAFSRLSSEDQERVIKYAQELLSASES